MRAGLYARVSTHDQQTLDLQTEAMTSYINDRGWKEVKRIKDVGSGSKDRPGRESLLQAARRREVDVLVVWRLDRWGRSLLDSQAPSGALAYKNFRFLRSPPVLRSFLTIWSACRPILV